MKIIKRNGEIVKYDKTKIENAVYKAMKEVGTANVAKSKLVAKDVTNVVSNWEHTPTIKEIEDEVFKSLIINVGDRTAKAYESYRAVQEYKRLNNTIDDAVIGLINRTNKELLDENSNKNGVLANTQRDLIAGEVSKDYLKRKMLPIHITQAIESGQIHYHDMDYAIQPIFNCALINLEDMLMNGTFINEKQINSPTSFPTACLIATQIALQVSNAQYGGQSMSVKHLAPFLRRSFDKYYKMFYGNTEYCNIGFDEKTSRLIARDLMMKDLKDGVQSFRYQLSSMTGCSGQSPFLTLYLEVENGSEYEYEEALIVEEFMKQRIEGMQNRKGQNISEAFPKYIYLLDEHNNLSGGKYDYLTQLSIDCNIKRMAPDYQSAKIMRQNYGATFPAMGCRSHLGEYRDENGERKYYGRFNQGKWNCPLVA